MVNTDSTKLPIALLSYTSKGYKCNHIIRNLHWSKRISVNFANEDKPLIHIKTKFLKTGNPLRLVDSIIKSFQVTMDAENFLLSH